MIYDITYMTYEGKITHKRNQEVKTLKDAMEQARRFWPCMADKATLYVGQENGVRWETVYKDTVTLSMLQERLSYE